MKNAERIDAYNAIVAKLSEGMGELTPARVADKDCFLMPTGVVDENGNPIFATLSVTVKDTVGSVTHPPFDPEEAKEAYTVHEAEVEKRKAEQGTKKEPKRNEEYARKMQAIEDAVRNWAMTDMQDGKDYTTTEILTTIPELKDNTLLEVGKVLTRIAKENILLEKKKKEGKNYYCKM